MATPAEVANDMSAQARFWHGRDGHMPISKTCADAARMIRAHLAGEPVDGRTWGGLHRRLLNLEDTSFTRRYNIADNLLRARLTLEKLRREAGAGAAR